MTMRGCLGFVLFSVVAALTAYADDKDAVAKELKKLQGTWIVSSVDEDGKKMPAETLKKQHEVRIEGKKMKYILNDKADEDREATLEIDPSRNPHEITVRGQMQGQETTSEGIYEVDEKTLKLCFNVREKGRPKKFPTKDTKGVALVVLKRK